MQVLPAWVGWVNLVYVPLAFVASFVVQGLLALVTARIDARGRDLHWTLRARRIAPLLGLARRLSALLCALFAVAVALSAGPVSHVGPGALVPAVVAAVFAGSFGPSWQLVRRLRATPAPDAATWLRTYVFRILMLSPYYVAIGLMCVFPPRFETWVWIGLGAAAAFAIFVNVGGLVLLGRGLGLLAAAPPRLAAVASEAAARAGVPLRAIWLARVGFANAFALPLARQIIVTEPAVDLFDDPELAAVCAHELGHVAEGPWANASRVLVSLALVSLAAVRPVYGTFGGQAMLLYVLGIFVALRLWPRLARRLESRSDALAHRHEGEPGTYARALEKLYARELMPAVGYGKGGTHPHLYDRLQAAGITPDYSRPAPPSRWLGAGAFVGLYLLLSVVAVAVGLGLTAVRFSRSATLLEIGIGLFGGGGTAFDSLAEARLTETGDPDVALALERQAVALSPGSTEYAMRLAYYLALAGQCEESRTVMTEASARPRGRRGWRVEYIVESYGHAWMTRCERAAGGSGVRLTP